VISQQRLEAIVAELLAAGIDPPKIACTGVPPARVQLSQWLAAMLGYGGDRRRRRSGSEPQDSQSGTSAHLSFVGIMPLNWCFSELHTGVR
jgi:hypothetical protein